MGLRDRLKALEDLAQARLPRPPPKPNPTNDQIRAWASDVRAHMSRGYFTDATPTQWNDILDLLAFADKLEDKSPEQLGPG